MTRPVHIAMCALLSLLLVACGGGGGGSNQPAPPAGLGYPAPPNYTINVAITALNPTVNGSVTSYTISPALPAGLSLNTTTGVISGTPTSLQASTNYTVTAANGGGMTSAIVAITVNDTAPGIGYPRDSYALNTDAPLAPIVPATTGGAILGWTIDKPLPRGLGFDSSNGQIRGTPREVAAAQDYVISAQNSGGTDTFTLSISVGSNVLLDLGHSSEILSLVRVGNRIASSGGRTNLWDAASGALLAKCEGCSLVGIAGGRMVAVSDIGFRVFSAATGDLVAEVSTDPVHLQWRTLSSDGNYFCGGDVAGFTCWNTNGTALFTHLGDYQDARSVATGTHLYVGNGPTGTHNLEVFALPGGTMTTSPTFAGDFHSWFADGARFLTTAGMNVAVLALDTTQLDFKNLPDTMGLAGQGDWFYTTAADTLTIYRVGSSTAPAASFPGGDATYPAIAWKSGTGSVARFAGNTVTVVDLGGTTPTGQLFTAPLGQHLTAFGSSAASQWVVGNSDGVVMDSIDTATPRLLNHGKARSISGNDTRLAIAVGAGRILYFNSGTRALEGELPLLVERVQVSDDGTRLASGPNSAAGRTVAADTSLRVHSLPTEDLLASWAYSDDGEEFTPDADNGYFFDFAGSGDVIARFADENSVPVSRAERLDGSPVWDESILDGSGSKISPDATRLATAGTLYLDDTMTGVFTGNLLGWLDDSHVLLSHFTFPNTYVNTTVVDTAGVQQLVSTIPSITRFQRLTGTMLYSPERNSIYDLATSAAAWAGSVSNHQGEGAVIGDAVVFSTTDGNVLIESR